MFSFTLRIIYRSPTASLRNWLNSAGNLHSQNKALVAQRAVPRQGASEAFWLRSIRIHLKLQEWTPPWLEWIPSESEAASVSAEVAQAFRRQAPKGGREDNGRSSDKKLRGVSLGKMGKKGRGGEAGYRH